jgi:hypothetical protein
MLLQSQTRKGVFAMMIRSFAAVAAILAMAGSASAGPQDGYSGCREARLVERTPGGYRMYVPSGNDGKGPLKWEQVAGNVYTYNNGSGPAAVCLGYNKDGVPVVYDASVASRGKQ